MKLELKYSTGARGSEYEIESLKINANQGDKNRSWEVDRFLFQPKSISRYPASSNRI